MHSCSVRIKRVMRSGKYAYPVLPVGYFNVFYNVNEFYVFFSRKFYILLINYQSRIDDILTVIFKLNRDCFRK